MKRSMTRFCFWLTAGCVLLLGGCKAGNQRKFTPQQNEETREKAFAIKIGILDTDFIEKFYPADSKLANLSFAGRSYLGKNCTRITPVEGGKTTVALPAADNKVCPIGNPTAPPAPRKRVPVGTSFPGIGLIGRLELEVTSSDTQKDYLWATAFKVGEHKFDNGTFDLIATTCHALQPIIIQEKPGDPWRLNLQPDQKLKLDLGERTDYLGSKYEVTKLVAYGQKEGLDVALLAVEHFSNDKLLFVTPKQMGSIKLDDASPVTVIGYVDFLHPVDPLFDLSYGPFTSFGDDKFISLGRFSHRSFQEGLALDAKKFDEQSYLLHDAATSMGQSGSPIFAGEDLENAAVLGVHVCCTAYWNNEKGYPPVDEKMIPCGRVTRAGYNKAVSSADIFNDKALCKALYDYGGLPSGYTCRQ
jgi:Trypsin-like peptidase domain